MTEVVRKVSQAVFLWAIAVGLMVWAPVFRFPQLWMLIGISILANVLQPSYALFGGSRTKEDRGTFDQIMWTVYLSQVAALVELVVKKPPSLPFDAVSWVALAAMIAGLALRTWAVVILGKFFTLNLQVQADQKIVEIGPYRVIRHPSYAGALLTFVASCVLLRSWVAVALASITLPIAFLRRIRHEERLLLEGFPEYATYAARTGALIPRMFSLAPRGRKAALAAERVALGRSEAGSGR